ncbi:hypothetical protein [Natronolimnobius sp. AArcel1]|uniref:hypothetical protein n=1 Tax=Natronolimnobius sp. AArcel1 TaxID=1679093 RepID=UPI0013EB0FDF|nr:hypothetical protein [Natronolimnobius sp. AArcel1]
MFGVLTFDPGEDQDSMITLSGDPEEWESATPLDTASDAFSPVSLDDGYDAGRTLTRLTAAADCRYLSLRLDYEDLGSEVDWDAMNTLVLLDTIPNQGNTTIPYNTDLETNNGVDFLVHLSGPDDSRVVVDAYYDIFYYFYADQLEMLPQEEYAGEKDTGEFHDIQLALNKELTIPSTGETIDFESYDTGALHFGNGDPASDDFDSLTDVCVTPEENMIEIRLPWLLLNFGDPSQREVIADFWEEDLEMGEFIGGSIDHISLTAVTFNPDDDGDATDLESNLNITDSLSAIEDGTLTFDSAVEFSWETWEEPPYHERRKQSYYILQEAFSDL